MGKNNNLVLVGVVLFGVVAAGLTAYMLMGNRGGNPTAGATAAPAMVSQWTALRPIPPRTAIRRDMLEETQIEAGNAAPGAITDLASLRGKLASQTIEAGQPLTEDVVVDAIKRVTPANIPVPAGLRAVAVWVDPDQTAAGLVDAGDRVDVVANHKIEYKNPATGSTGRSVAGRTIAQDLLVLAVDRSINAPKLPGPGGAGGPAPAPTAAPPPPPTGTPVRTRVLLAANPVQAERIVAANESGTIHLTIRNPGTRDQFAIPEAIEYPARIVDTMAMERAEKLRAERRQETAAAQERQYTEKRANLQYRQEIERVRLEKSVKLPPFPIPNPAPVERTTIVTQTEVQQQPVNVREVTVIRGNEKSRVTVPPG